jgi:hypothetical protein
MAWVGQPRPAETVVADPYWVVVLAWLVLVAVGAGLGWLLLPAADWLAGLDWAPMRGPARVLADLPRGWATAGAVTLGVLGGVLMAVQVMRDSLRVVVRDDRLTVSRQDRSTVVARPGVAAVFLDGGRLVVLDAAGRELARERSDQRPGRLAGAFAGHGWPWRDGGDPYRERYRRWVPEYPDLPAGAHALFTARERALRRGDGEDAADLRAELARLDLVVRDEDKRQYWRRVGAEPS